MKADPFVQLKLLDLQALDSRADHLRHQRDHLPEHEQLAAAERERAALAGQERDQRIVVDDLTAEQAKVDADVEQVKARRTRDQQRMDQGLISNPKDLQHMQQELESLNRRITSLEDQELEVMERLEEAQSELTGLGARLADLDGRLDELRARRDEQSSTIAADLDQIQQEREPLAQEMPDDLRELYDRLREQKGGVGAAALRARACEGCRLTLDNAELADIRKAASDVVLRCEECQRILVRTHESGL